MTGVAGEHTPGPWVMLTRGDDTIVVMKRDADGNPHKHIAEMAWAASENGEPDARLIAAAPELLEALEEVRPYVQNVWEAEGDEFTRRKLALIDTAIAKARGQ